MMERLEWGLNGAAPDTARAAWGARAIIERNDRPPTTASRKKALPPYTVGLVPGRQCMVGDEDAREALAAALNGGALKAALERACEEFNPYETRTVTIYEDACVVIVADPRSSYGYLLMAAWLKET